MLTSERALKILTSDDALMREEISLTGRGMLLLLCTESLVTRIQLEAVSRLAINDIYGLLADAADLLGGTPVPYKSFEEHLLSEDEKHGFMCHFHADPARRETWGCLMSVTGWFGAIASDIQGGSSYLCDVDDYDSINDRFSHTTSDQRPFGSWMYCGEVLRFVLQRFPNHGEYAIEPADFGATKREFLAYLATAR